MSIANTIEDYIDEVKRIQNVQAKLDMAFDRLESARTGLIAELQTLPTMTTVYKGVEYSTDSSGQSLEIVSCG